MNQKALAEIVAQSASEHGVIGAQTSLLVDGDVISVSAGLSDAETPTAMTNETTMPIASVTKPMVATVVLRLAERGRLNLDDSIASCVPELSSSEWAGSATIRQMLANTSGVPLRPARENMFPTTGPDAFALLASDIAPDPALTPPGEVWGYQNTGWNVLGRVIEVASEMSWENAMRSELFEPLQMTSTRFHYENDIVNPSQNYEVRGTERLLADTWSNRPNGPGGAGLWSSALDLIRFARPHVESEEYSILREPHASPPTPNFLDDWCLGMARFRYEGGPVWGWDGIGPGHRSILRFIPGRGAIALLTNSSTGRNMYRSVFPDLFRRCFDVSMRDPFLAGDSPRMPMDRFAGTFGWPDTSMTFDVSDGNLILSIGGQSAPLHRIGDATFVFDQANPADSTFTFANFDSEGQPQLLYRLVWPFPRTA